MVEGASLQIVVLRILRALFHLEVVQVKEHHTLALRQLPSIYILDMLLLSLISVFLAALLPLLQV